MCGERYSQHQELGATAVAIGARGTKSHSYLKALKCKMFGFNLSLDHRVVVSKCQGLRISKGLPSLCELIGSPLGQGDYGSETISQEVG